MLFGVSISKPSIVIDKLKERMKLSGLCERILLFDSLHLPFLDAKFPIINFVVEKVDIELIFLGLRIQSVDVQHAPQE